MRGASDLVETLAMAPLRPLTRGLALWRAVRRGADIYRENRGTRHLPGR